jgi:hypothetical protein
MFQSVRVYQRADCSDKSKPLRHVVMTDLVHTFKVLAHKEKGRT